MKSARSRSRSSVDATWITRRTLSLDRPALAPPARNAPLDHVDDLSRPEALQDGGAPRRPLAASADGRDRALRVASFGPAADVVVGHVDRARDVSLVPLDALADVEHLDGARVALPALVQLADRHPLNTVARLGFLAPRPQPVRA